MIKNTGSRKLAGKGGPRAQDGRSYSKQPVRMTRPSEIEKVLERRYETMCPATCPVPAVSQPVYVQPDSSWMWLLPLILASGD